MTAAAPARPALRLLATLFAKMFAAVAIGVLIGVTAMLAWQRHCVPATRAATESVVHDYILAHPEVLLEAVDRMRQNEAVTQLSSLRPQIVTPFPGATLGNPRGRVTLVEFSDYACGFCRASLGDVATLIAANPDLRIVIRELPVLTPASIDAARMALAAAQQGRYAAFRDAMFARGAPDAASIAAAAAAAGIDPARARGAIAAPAVQAEIERNLDLYRALGLRGTPGWVAGNQALTGAVGMDALSRAIAAARG